MSPVRANGTPVLGSDETDGVALATARARKRTKYPELAGSGRYRLLVAAVETGGRWGPEAYQFLLQMAHAKARTAPRVLRQALITSWVRRWTGMISYAVHDAYAASLVEEVPADTTGTDGELPCLGAVLSAP